MSETEVAMNRFPREREHAEIMRLADDYADESRSQQLGVPSKKRSELYVAVWKALGLACPI